MLLKTNLFGDKTPFERPTVLNYWDSDTRGMNVKPTRSD